MNQDIELLPPEPDLLDRTDLPLEETIVFSSHMEKVLREAVREEIKKLPMGSLIASILEKEIEAHKKLLTEHFDKNAENVKANLNREIEKLKAEIEKHKEKMTKRHDEFKSLFGRDAKPWYQFGGYPIGGTPGGDGGEADSVEGIDLDGEDGELLWRLQVVDGNLSVQKLVDDVWTEASVFEVSE